MIRLLSLLLAATLAVVVGFSGSARADSDSVLQVFSIEVEDGELDGYLKMVAKTRPIVERLGTQGTMRAWIATAAGEGTGVVVIAIEYPSLAAYADGVTKLNADAEMQKLLPQLREHSELVASSLYREITP